MGERLEENKQAKQISNKSLLDWKILLFIYVLKEKPSRYNREFWMVFMNEDDWFVYLDRNSIYIKVITESDI